MRASLNFKTFAGILTLTALILPFQNCSKSSFGGSDGGAPLGKSDLSSEAGASGLDATDEDGLPVDRSDTRHVCGDHRINEVIQENTACDSMFNLAGTVNLKGKDRSISGAHDRLLLANGGDLRISGTSENLAVNGARSIVLNGSHGSICLKAQYFSLAGNYGVEGVPTVLIGQGSKAELPSVSGRRDSDLVLVNIKNVGSISGTSRDIFIDGGTVQSVGGNSRDIYLKNGARIIKFNGVYRNLIQL